MCRKSGPKESTNQMTHETTFLNFLPILHQYNWPIRLSKADSSHTGKLLEDKKAKEKEKTDKFIFK